MKQDFAAILSIGNELLSGAVLNSNSTVISSKLRSIGFETSRVSVVRDDVSEIAEEIVSLSRRFSLIVVTGGLGPTTDDVTRDAAAKALGAPLELSAKALAKLENSAKNRGHKLNNASKRQAYFPRGASIIENPVGTADAFMVRLEGESENSCYVYCLPGVPGEMQHLLEHNVIPCIREKFPNLAPPPRKALQCFGLSESHIGSVIESCSLAEFIEVAYRPMLPTVLVTLTARGGAPEQEKGYLLSSALSSVKTALGSEYVFAEDETSSLASCVGELLVDKGLTLSAAESCTGGLLAHTIVSVPGASKFFRSSVVTYANEAKEVFLNVKPRLLEQEGAVSYQVALDMARTTRVKVGADIGISTTGIAGPSGGTKEKPVGTAWIGLSADGVEQAIRVNFPAERNAFRTYVAAAALDVVRRKLLSLTLSEQ